MCKSSCKVCNPPKPEPWRPRVTHTKLSDGRVVPRGSQEEALHKYGDLVR